jgi:acyl carrier protein
MVANSTIAEQIRTALGEYLKRDPSSIEPHQTLREDLGLDSMATIELLFKIEETFDLQIPDQDLQKLVKVSDVIAYVQDRVGMPERTPAELMAQRETRRKRQGRPR